MIFKRQIENVEKSLLANRTSMLGIIVTIVALFLILFFIGIDFMSGETNPYTGIITYMMLPVVLFLGIFLIIIGVILEHRRKHLSDPDTVPRFPTIDLNSHKTRRTIVWVAVFSMGFLLLTGVGSYRAYHLTDSVAFCGKTCHQVLKPEYTAYTNSPHARVKCVHCHIGPGAGWFVKSKLSGMYEVYATVFDLYPRPIPVPVKNLRPAQETCEQCHWPKQFYGAVQKENYHFLSDEENTPWVIKLLIKVGGGDPTFAPVGGIHWHMSIDNKIEYIAADKLRQEMIWIRKTDENGTVTIYKSDEEPLEKEPEAYEIRTMDCIDCHDRPTHIFRSPMNAVNLSLQTGRLERDLPYIKAKGVELLEEEYESTEVALQEISDNLRAYYKEEYPELYKAEQNVIEDAVDELQTIYRNNFFPKMKVRWDVYPDNIGHLMWKGCFRCHNGNLRTETGEGISKDCDSCHIIISQGTGEEVAVSLKGLEFEHPVDMGEAWKEMNCNECHTGALP
jgi:hypothetical protein